MALGAVQLDLTSHCIVPWSQEIDCTFKVETWSTHVTLRLRGTSNSTAVAVPNRHNIESFRHWRQVIPKLSYLRNNQDRSGQMCNETKTHSLCLFCR
jgi:hypothetical protein